MTKLIFNANEIARTFEVFQGGLHELRVIPYKGVTQPLAGYFDNAEDIVKEIRDKNLESVPFFMTLNEVDPDAECIGRLNVIRKSCKTVSDKNIIAYKKLHIDLDPEKSEPHGQATDEEVKYAEAKMHEVYNRLTESGFPEGIISFSGNGYNIDYYVNIANTTENKAAIKSFLKILSDLFSDEHVKIDTTTYNPGRVIKYYGCVSGKGENTVDRPYRLTKILSVPDIKQELSLEKISEFIAAHSKKDSSKIKSRSKASNGDEKLVAKIADVDNWLDSYNIAYSKKDCDYNGEECSMYILEECPFTDHDNQNCSFIIKYINGNCYFKCHHDHCNYTIHDLISKYPIVNQLPLILGENDKIKIYNSVASEISLILSNDNRKYVLNNKTKEVLAFDGMDFDNLIIQKAQQQGLIISNTAVTTLKGNFRSNYGKYSIRRPVSRRIAYRDKNLYYAINRENIISITTEKIEKYNGEDVLFYYGENYVDQTVPDLTSAASALPDLVKQCFNISDEYLLCFLAHLCTLYMPNVNSPILLLSGGQGTSKSTTAKKIKSLVDPTHTDVMSMPEKESDLYASLSSGYLVAYDNIAEISNSFSDILCIAVTGGVATKRRLFTDNDLVEVSLHTNVILNGIDNDIVKKTDLAERCNTIYLERIRHRLTDKQVWKAFEVIKPKLLGSILNTIKIGLSYVDEMIDTIDELPRMADFAVYGAAMIKAMGQNYNEFLSQYMHSTNEMLSDRAELDDFVVLIKRFLNSNSGYWYGGAEELLKELQAFAESKRLYIGKFTSNTLSRKLNSMATSLKAAGISFDRGRLSDRYIELTKEVEKLPSPTLEELLADD